MQSAVSISTEDECRVAIAALVAKARDQNLEPPAPLGPLFPLEDGITPDHSSYKELPPHYALTRNRWENDTTFSSLIKSGDLGNSVPKGCAVKAIDNGVTQDAAGRRRCTFKGETHD